MPLPRAGRARKQFGAHPYHQVPLLNRNGEAMRERRIREIEALEPHAEAVLVYDMMGRDSIHVNGIRCAYCGREYQVQLPALIRHLQESHGVVL